MFLTVNLFFTVQVFLAECGLQNWTLYALNINEKLFSFSIQMSAASQFSYPLLDEPHLVMML